MSKKLFFYEKDDEICYTLSGIKEKMKRFGLTEKIVFEAEPDTFTKDAFYCSHFKEPTSKGYCGKDCEGYDPKNKKSGCCHHVGRLYEVGKEKIIKLKQ